MKYEDSGVSISKAERIKKEIGKLIKSTWGKEVLSEVGHFGGMFRLSPDRGTVLVSSIDGVGTKLLVARMADRYDTVGRDLVNHCVNDIIVQGAVPLFFLDYIAAGSLDPRRVRDIVKGLAGACRDNGCALIAGETAEMPGIYRGDDFDLAGCIVGMVDERDIIDGRRIRPGDLIFGLPSSGLHTNGYSLARKIFFEELGLDTDSFLPELGSTVGDELLKVHTSYLAHVKKLRECCDVKGLVHVTGGGITGNFMRILPADCRALIKKDSWPIPPVFTFLQDKGRVEDHEMYNVFNMGMGMLLVIPGEDEGKLEDSQVNAFKVGEIKRGTREVKII